MLVSINWVYWLILAQKALNINGYPIDLIIIQILKFVINTDWINMSRIREIEKKSQILKFVIKTN